MSVDGQQEWYRFLVSTLLFSILQPSSKYILCLKECLWELGRETSARNTAGKTPCCIWAANLASRSVAYTFTQNRIIIFRICQNENVCWEILFSEVHCLHFTYPERRRAWRGLSGRSQRGRVCVCVCVCVCVKSSVHFLQISVPPWCRKTTHYRKVGVLYFLIHLEELSLTFAKRHHLIFQIHIQFYYLSVFCLLVCITFFATCFFFYVLIRFKLTVCRYVVNNFFFCS